MNSDDTINPLVRDITSQTPEDPLERSDFDVITYINELFPNEDSLNKLDTVISKVEKRIQAVDKQICSVVCAETPHNWQITNNNIRELLVRIEEIKTREEIRGDIRKWNVGKTNLSESISTLTQVHMLMQGIQSLELFTESRQYNDASHMLRALSILASKLSVYKNTHVQSLLSQLGETHKLLAERIYSDFKSVVEHIAKDDLSTTLPMLAEASTTLTELGNEYIEPLVCWICDHYANIFVSMQDGWLHAVTLRIKYIKRMLSEFENQFGGVFPTEWELSERLAIRFCWELRNGLTDDIEGRGIGGEDILVAVRKLTEFENLLQTRLSAENLLEGGSFNGIVTSCFRPHVGVYKTALENNLRDITHNEEDDTMDDTHVLSSAVQLFFVLGGSVDLSAHLGLGFSYICKFLNDYAEHVLNQGLLRVTSDQKSQFFQSSRRLTSSDIEEICVVISTAGFCTESAYQLLSGYSEVSKTENPFKGVLTNAINVLCDDLIGLCRPHLKTMSKFSWQNVVTTGNEGGHISAISDAMEGWIPSVRAHLSHNLRYFILFCRHFLDVFVEEYLESLMKCRQVVPLAAEQLLLDTYSIKMCLQNLPVAGSSHIRSPPTSYSKAVNEEMNRAELILKVIMSSGESDIPEFVHSYLQHCDSPSVNHFERILDMKGVKKSDMCAYIECYMGETGLR